MLALFHSSADTTVKSNFNLKNLLHQVPKYLELSFLCPILGRVSISAIAFLQDWGGKVLPACLPACLPAGSIWVASKLHH